MEQTLKLGKTPARPNAVTFKMVDFVNMSELPKIPLHFGHEDLVQDWGMLGNDKYGDCVLAGAAHETMMWNREASIDIPFNEACTLESYSAITGFNPDDPDTDQGTDMEVAAAYRRKTGIVDATGNRHGVQAYLSLEPGNLKQHYAALYLFGAVGIGIEFPASAMDQFNQGKPWRVVKNSRIEGGHYVPLVAKRRSLQCVTWGKIQAMTTGFFKKYNDESIAYVSLEMMVDNKSPELFDAAKLVEYLNGLRRL